MAMQVAKKCWHQCLADDASEITTAVAMMGRAVCGMNNIEQYTAGRIGARLLLKATETFFELAIDDLIEVNAPQDKIDEMRKARDEAIAVRTKSAQRPGLTLVPEPAND